MPAQNQAGLAHLYKHVFSITIWCLKRISRSHTEMTHTTLFPPLLREVWPTTSCIRYSGSPTESLGEKLSPYIPVRTLKLCIFCMDSVALSNEKYGLIYGHAFLCSTDNNTVAEQLVQADCYTERLLTFEETVWIHAHTRACMHAWTSNI
jgi:hypothetical protein